MDFTAFCKLVGENIRRARHISGRTQEEISSVTLRYFQEIERGERNPSLEVLFEIAEELGVTVADLTDVEGARLSTPRLEKRKAPNAPRPGRKPKGHPRSR